MVRLCLTSCKLNPSDDMSEGHDDSDVVYLLRLL